ncbi:MAG: metal ABC transporter ATP-binding protein [Anaerolineales bacterium]|jgi:manganese/iron transport system ATP-binding protein
MAQLTARFTDHIIDAPPIHLEDISVHFNGTEALLGITAEIEPGKRIAIVGPNGAGKTTLLQVIAGVLTPDHGKVQVYGHHPQRHVCIAYVPQRSQADWDFPVNVRETVMMGRIRKIGLFRWPKQKDWNFVDSSLQQVGMQSSAERQIGELSGGQQQRVFLAQALAQEAEVILLDEPLNGLDAPSQEAILDILDDLSERGVTVLVATHDLDLARARFDQIMLINRRLIDFGSPDDVLVESNLLEAYGGSMRFIEGEDGRVLLTDTCCEGEEDPHHHGGSIAVSG